MDEGKNRVLQILFGSQVVDGVLYLGLYRDSTEPVEGDGLGDLTEVTSTGYARKPLTRGSWIITDDLAEYAQQMWTAQTNWGNIYGYFLATSADNSGKLLAIDHFETPYDIQSGKGIKVTPKIQVS